MISGGHMVLTFCGRSVEDPSSKDDCAHLNMLGETLLDMVKEGLVQEAELHSFKLPIYTPSKQELEAIIQNEGSFNLVKLEEFEIPWDPSSYTVKTQKIFQSTNIEVELCWRTLFGLLSNLFWLLILEAPLMLMTYLKGIQRRLESIFGLRNHHSSIWLCPYVRDETLFRIERIQFFNPQSPVVLSCTFVKMFV